MRHPERWIKQTEFESLLSIFDARADIGVQVESLEIRGLSANPRGTAWLDHESEAKSPYSVMPWFLRFEINAHAVMSELFLTILGTLFSAFQCRSQLLLQNLALRHQLVVLQRTSPKPKLRNPDRLLWLALPRVLRRWQKGLVIVQPQTVIQWHRRGFLLFWRWKSRTRQRPNPTIPAAWPGRIGI